MNTLNNKRHRIEKAKNWIKSHKLELSIGAGVLVLTGIGIVIGLKFKNQVKVPITKIPLIPDNETIQITHDFIDEVSSAIGSPKAPHPRRDYTRNLGNRNPSPQKIIEAIEKGIELLPHQTYVNECYING